MKIAKSNAVFLPPGGGKAYDWSADNTVVKVSAEDSGGAYTLMEDSLKPGFRLGLHLHRAHAETFYVLAGPVWFFIENRWIEAETGSTIHIPPGVPHAVEQSDDASGKLLMIYQPAGFDQFLAEMTRLSPDDSSDPAVMAALNDRYDLVLLGDPPTKN